MARMLGDFVPALEQKHFDERVLPLRPARPGGNAVASTSSSTATSSTGNGGGQPLMFDKFQAMSGRKRHNCEVISEEDDDDDMDDDDLDDDGGVASGSGAAAGAGGGGKKAKHPRKRNSTSTGRRKISISYIDDKSKRHVSFTKRKAGLMKKAFELSTLTGTELLVLVVSETGMVYTYATPSLKPVVELDHGRKFIQSALRGDLSSSSSSISLPGPAPATSSDAPEHAMDEGIAVDAQFDVPYTDNNQSTARPPPPPPPPAPDLMLDPHLASILSSSQSFATPSTSAPSHSFFDPLASSSNPFPTSFPAPAPVSSSAYSFPSLPTSAVASTSSASPSQAQLPRIVSEPRTFEQTPYDRVAPSMAAYATYRQRDMLASRARQQGQSGQQFSEAAKTWRSPSVGSVPMPSPPLVSPSGSATQSGSMGPPDSGRRQGDVRTLVKEEAAVALSEAQSKRDIASFLRAHSLQVRAHAPFSSLVEPAPVEGIRLTMQQFGEACEDLGLTAIDELERATQAFLEYILPARKCTPKRLQEARTHLALFFDFLEGNSLISPPLHHTLTLFRRFDASNSHSLPIDVARSLEAWAVRASRRWDGWADSCPSEGWFEVYRVRGNFVLLKEKDLKGDPAINACLAPWKMRLPRGLTPFLKLEDAIHLTIHKVPHKSFYIPTSVYAFEPAESSDGMESDVDPSSYAVELARLERLSDPPADVDEVRNTREVLAMLTRARDALEEGELSD